MFLGQSGTEQTREQAPVSAQYLLTLSSYYTLFCVNCVNFSRSRFIVKVFEKKAYLGYTDSVYFEIKVRF